MNRSLPVKYEPRFFTLAESLVYCHSVSVGDFARAQDVLLPAAWRSLGMPLRVLQHELQHFPLGG